jgi:hypothetical protein
MMFRRKKNKICIIGTSQTICLLEALDELHASGVKSMFGSENSSYIKENLKLEEGRLIALDETLSKFWEDFTGQNYIDLDEYESFILFGFDAFTIRCRFFSEYGNMHFSEQCLNDFLSELFNDHPAHLLANIIREYKRKAPIWILNGPCFSRKHKIFNNKDLGEKFLEIHNIYNNFWKEKSLKNGWSYCEQPADMLDETEVCTKSEYMIEDQYHFTTAGALHYLKQAL